MQLQNLSVRICATLSLTWLRALTGSNLKSALYDIGKAKPLKWAMMHRRKAELLKWTAVQVSQTVSSKAALKQFVTV